MTLLTLPTPDAFDVDEVLSFLDLARADPTADYLHDLVAAYVRHVPWETAFRIAKRAATQRTEACPRWPAEFWQDAIHRGGGGTCYESNYAFFSLLRTLGFDGYLTINDMNESRGCHSALVIEIDGDRWLTDVGIPLYVPVPLVSGQTTQAESAFHTYTLTPQSDGVYSDGVYEVSRDRHPKPYIFTFFDRPVDDGVYRTITTNDYGRDGLFLDAVILCRVMDGHVWRYNGRGEPPLLERFGPEPSQQVIAGDAAPMLADLFDMDANVLSAAFRA